MANNVELEIKKYKQEGDLTHEYNPLRNKLNSENKIVDFNTDELKMDLSNPLNIECQPSYDGTVNLIINDDKNPPRIINSRFSKLEDNKYKIINRNQLEQTNLYKEGKIDRQTRLFRNVNKIPKIDLIDVLNVGKLKGGNYTFYVKFADDDYNKTDIVAESGQVSVFKGSLSRINSISGTILDELTDKAITLKISNIDTSFSQMYISFVRTTCDTNGIKLIKAFELVKPYRIQGNSTMITINGFEELKEISEEELNIKYNLVTATKTQAQVQNMLFFGNIQGVTLNIKDLQNLSYFIKVTLKQSKDSIGWISQKDYSQKIEQDDLNQAEYYSPGNIYYKLGYWPDEIYRLGVVYIMNDDSLSPVFNLRGAKFSEVGNSNLIENLYKDGKINYIPKTDFISSERILDNTFGVFKNPNISVFNYKDEKTNPLYYEMSLSKELRKELHKLGVKGFFFVRQKRIPTSLCQGLSVGIDRTSYVPMLYNSDKNCFFSESFLSKNRTLVQNFKSHEITTKRKQCSGLLSLDVNIIKTLQDDFDGSSFVLKSLSTKNGELYEDKRHFWVKPEVGGNNEITANTIFVNSNTPMKYVNGYGFSTKCGSQEDVSQFSFFEEKEYGKENYKLLRGLYCPFLGTNQDLTENQIYTIKIPNYAESLLQEYFLVRKSDTSPYYAISDRYGLDEYLEELDAIVDVYRGDCFTETVTIRLNRNFVDSLVPINNIIIDPETWKKNYNGYLYTNNKSEEDDKDKGSYLNINRGDVNAVNLGMWVTFKVLSNYNLGLRSEDLSHTDEHALMGNPRSFYPLNDISTDSSSKIEESWLLNQGYGSTVGVQRHFVSEDVPYIKELFDNRVMFSNVQIDGDFKNAYRIFQGLSYKDIDRQYGAIVKFLPWNNNILCIFEHGIGLLPVNEKALIQTSTNQSIHMYGAGVLQNQISLISPDFGSIWPESIIKTPIGVYGVDTYAKKIWRYSSNNGLETISDMKIQGFLNDHIKLSEADKYPIIALKNVKTHYNNYKGDVMFTFYNENKNESWNICFNERMNKWITRYSWTPLYSENINNVFYSLDQRRAKIISYIYNSKHCTYGVHTDANEWIVNSINDSFSIKETISGYNPKLSFTTKIESIDTSFINELGEEINISLRGDTAINNLIASISSWTSNNPTNEIRTKSYSEIKNFFENSYNIDVPVYFILTNKISLNLSESTSTTFIEKIAFILKNNVQNITINNKQRETYLINGFFVHGKAGIFDKINYENESLEDQILPTKWYNKQEPFEFEFVVNGDVGFHKIFDNLVIVSNNVQPSEIEYEIEGDVYRFNKSGIFKKFKFNNLDELKNSNTQRFVNCEVERNTNLNSYYLNIKQPCLNMNDSKFRRRLGNIQYKEDSWYLVIDPLKFREANSEEELSDIEALTIIDILNRRITLEQSLDWESLKKKYKNGWSKLLIWDPNFEKNIINNKIIMTDMTMKKLRQYVLKSTRLRDKYIKIRVKYTGQDLVIITALKTLLTNSYA